MLTAECKSFFLDLQCRVSGMRCTSLQKPAQAAHTMGTVRNAHLPGNMGIDKSGESGFQDT